MLKRVIFIDSVSYRIKSDLITIKLKLYKMIINNLTYKSMWICSIRPKNWNDFCYAYISKYALKNYVRTVVAMQKRRCEAKDKKKC